MASVDPWAGAPPAISDAHTDGDAADTIARAVTPIGSSAFTPQDGDAGPGWRFKRSAKGDDNDDPTEDEFFRDGSLTRALVRETIQNALDAGEEIAPDRPVCVRFRLGESPREDLPAWMLEGLAQHIDVSAKAERPSEESCRWLLCEDFNTSGLIGDPYEDDPIAAPGATPNNYFYFWRNTGRTNKTNDERGSWGIGKAVFQTASRTRSFYGLTVRHDDGAALLRGKCVLDVHHLDGQRYFPRGHFGQFSSAEGEENFALPVFDAKRIQEFHEAFDTRRGDKSGLSVLVPWLDEKVDTWTVDTLAQSVCEQYFAPITAGHLTVEVCDGERVVSIDRESIDRVVEDEIEIAAARRVELQELIAFARWAITLPREEYLILNAPGTAKGTEWSGEIFPDDFVQQAREKYDAGEPIAVRCGVAVFPKGGDPVVEWFSVYLQQNDALPKPHVTYVRRGITIPEVDSQAPPGVRAMVMVDTKFLGKLLGDAENPAHTKWTTRRSRVGLRWDRPERAVGFVQKSVKSILSEMLSGKDEKDTKVFEDTFFFLKRVDDVMVKSRKKRKDTDKPKIDIPSREQAISISKLDGGVVVRGDSALDAGDEVTLRLAYSIRKGNSFKKWDERDFDVANLDVVVAAGTITKREGQHVRATVVDPGEFALSVKGFDEKRDLEIDARRIKETAS